MTLKQNTCEGGTNGTTVTLINSAAGGTAFDAVVIGTGGSVTYSTLSAQHGTTAIKITNPTGVTSHVDFTGFNGTQFVPGVYFRFPTLPGANGPVRLIDVRTNTVSVYRVLLNTSNVLLFQTNNGSTTLKTFSTPLTANTWYRIDVAGTPGNAADATAKMDYYIGDGTTPVETGYSSTTVTTGTTSNITQIFYGVCASPAGTVTVLIDDTKAKDGTLTYFGPAPSAVFSASISGLAVTVDGSTSTGAATPLTYDWDWGDSTTHGTGATPAAHTYSASGTYAVKLTVTDANSVTNSVTHSVTAASSAANVTVSTVDYSIGWTGVGGTVTAVVADTDNTTYVTPSSVPPTGLEYDVTLQSATSPAVGQPFKVPLVIDAPGATTATVNAQLFEGTTQRSSLTNQPVTPVASSPPAAVTGLTVLSFPYTDVKNVSAWPATLKVKLQITAA